MNNRNQYYIFESVDNVGLINHFLAVFFFLNDNKRPQWYFVTKIVLTYCSWGFLISNRLEQLGFKLEKNIGI